MRRLVVLALCVLAVGCGRSEPELTQEQKDALQTIGEWQGRDSDDGWRDPAAFSDARHVAESERLRFKVTRVRRQDIDGKSRLVVVWEVKNISESAKINDALPLDLNPSLHVTDELGNEYGVDGHMRFDGSIPEDYEFEPESLYPGDAASDALVCEPPVSGAKNLFVWFREGGDAESHAFAFKLNIPRHAQTP